MKQHQLDYTLRVRFPIVVFVAAVSFIATYYFSRAERDSVGYSPAQPIAFSHRLHAGTMRIDCLYCHTGATSSPVAAVPPVATCMNCHKIARRNSAAIIKLAGFFESGKALPWKRVHKLPDFVYFNHSAHVNREIGCSRCHGAVENMDVIMQVSDFTMAFCLECHRNAPQLFPNLHTIRKGPEYCSACHR